MSDNNNQVYDIAKLMTNNESLKSEIIGSIQGIIQEKYISQMQKAVKAQLNTIQQNPSKEVKLMSAIKEFYPETQHEQIDKMIDMLNILSTFKDLRNNINTMAINEAREISSQSINTKIKDESIHEDGIYDVDKVCFVKKQGQKADMLSTMMMMVFMGADR